MKPTEDCEEEVDILRSMQPNSNCKYKVKKITVLYIEVALAKFKITYGVPNNVAFNVLAVLVVVGVIMVTIPALQPSGFHSAPYSGGLRVKYLPVDRPT